MINNNQSPSSSLCDVVIFIISEITISSRVVVVVAFEPLDRAREFDLESTLLFKLPFEFLDAVVDVVVDEFVFVDVIVVSFSFSNKTLIIDRLS